jgi:hydroxypyruvate isomerase
LTRPVDIDFEKGTHPMIARNQRIRQSLAFWCWNVAGENWSVEKTCQVAQELGCPSVELVAPDDWHVLKKYGLTSALCYNGMPDPPFVKGFNNRAYWPEVVSSTNVAIEQAAAAGFPNVLAFTGYKWRDALDPASGEMTADEGADNCVEGIKQVVGHAEKHGVTLCLEMLNTRDDTHPMKGHPGYQGDDVDYVAEIIRRVGSPRLKLLFDVYHVQIMQGDVLRRLEQHRDLLGHIHVAGVPGRGELDDRQEINYTAVMHKLIEIGYDGFVGQEFVPTRDPMEGLREAVALCDV